MTKKKTTKKKAKRKVAKAKVKGGRVNGLPAMQWMFCQEYIVDLDATAAAKRAGYSEKTAAQIGWQILQKADVQQEIERLIEARAMRVGVHADRVVWELACIAFSDITELLTFNKEGVKLNDSVKLTSKQTRAIMEVRENISAHGIGSISFKLHSKMEALKTLALHLGMTKQQVDHTVATTDEAKVMFFPSNGREVPIEGDDDD